jgi:hypothetical protein
MCSGVAMDLGRKGSAFGAVTACWPLCSGAHQHSGRLSLPLDRGPHSGIRLGPDEIRFATAGHAAPDHMDRFYALGSRSGGGGSRETTWADWLPGRSVSISIAASSAIAVAAIVE